MNDLKDTMGTEYAHIENHFKELQVKKEFDNLQFTVAELNRLLTYFYAIIDKANDDTRYSFFQEVREIEAFIELGLSLKERFITMIQLFIKEYYKGDTQ